MAPDNPLGDESPLFNRFSNPYLTAKMTNDREEQLAALAQFSTEEAEKRFQMCEDLMPEGDIDNLDESDEGEWSYQKGYLDACRTFSGLHIQAYMTYTAMMQDADEGDESE